MGWLLYAANSDIYNSNRGQNDTTLFPGAFQERTVIGTVNTVYLTSRSESKAVCQIRTNIQYLDFHELAH